MKNYILNFIDNTNIIISKNIIDEIPLFINYINNKNINIDNIYNDDINIFSLILMSKLDFEIILNFIQIKNKNIYINIDKDTNIEKYKFNDLLFNFINQFNLLDIFTIMKNANYLQLILLEYLCGCKISLLLKKFFITFNKEPLDIISDKLIFNNLININYDIINENLLKINEQYKKNNIIEEEDNYIYNSIYNYTDELLYEHSILFLNNIELKNNYINNSFDFINVVLFFL